ncbi:TPA: NACHT domain-containing protein [Legionella pneumophila]
MNYISRKIQVFDNKGEPHIYMDEEFFLIQGPLVLLGEPGAGKSALLEKFEETTNSPFFIASAINLYPTIEEVSCPSKVIIDGVDEVTTYNEGSTLADSILCKLSNHVKPNFILSCRSADWQHSLNIIIIESRWKKTPTIGHLIPFSDNEIIQFINAIDESVDAHDFLLKARQENVVELIRNPKNLQLFLKAIKQRGAWPSSRRELYEHACIALVKEHSNIHRSKQIPPSSQTLIETAGFIFAQLLLSDSIGISINGEKNPAAPQINDLIQDSDKLKLSKYILSSMLFRLNSNNILVPCHRTIAEFLAAQWLSKNLRDKLSLRRLEAILYGDDFIVPSALRGLHAWLATFYQHDRNCFVMRDPYGYLKYGDPSVLTIEQARLLLASLQRVAIEDPYFRENDWHSSIGGEFLKPELKEDILAILHCKNTPFHLSYLIIQSIGLTKSNKLIDEMKDELIEILLDKNFSLTERNGIVECLSNCSVQVDWLNLYNQLRKMGDTNSLQVIIEIFKRKTRLINGSQLAEVILKIIDTPDEDSTFYIGLGYRLFNKLSLEHLEDCMGIFQNCLTMKEEPQKDSYKIQATMFQLIDERLVHNPKPDAKQLWSWLSTLDRDLHNRTHQDDKIRTFLLSDEDYRRKIQCAAIEMSSSSEDLWLILCLSHSWLWVIENDIKYQLQNILTLDIDDKDLRWKEIVRWIFVYQPFTGSALEYARTQASDSLILQSHLNDIETGREKAKKELQKFAKDKEIRTLSEKKQTVKRHTQYSAIQEQVLSGSHINAILQIAKAYLGWFNDIDGNGPKERVAELVGKDFLALEGIIAVIENNIVPSAQELIDLRVNQNLISPFEPILIAYCDLVFTQGKALSDIPINIAQSALVAYQLNHIIMGNGLSPQIKEQLEVIVFNDGRSKEMFIYEVIEPYLNSTDKFVPWLSQLKQESFFKDIAGVAAIKWLKEHPDLDCDKLREVLTIAICHAPEDLKPIIRKRIDDPSFEISTNKDLWLGASFIVDFEYHMQRLNDYATSNKNTLWKIEHFMFVNKQISIYWPKLNEHQLRFIIKHYGPEFPPVSCPEGGWEGNENPWDAYKLISNAIKKIALITTIESRNYINNLIEDNNLIHYRDELKHALANNKRNHALATKNFTLLEVQSVLLNEEPTGPKDLQLLLIDQLENFQKRLKHSETDEYKTYWNDNTPHVENYCRDRIIAALNPYLERFNVRLHKEGARSDETRCDILCTYNTIDLPIEIKGQWHPKMWTAASDQLKNYTNDYHTNGIGLYIVLWFGNIPEQIKPPKAWKRKRPKSVDEMRNYLRDCYQDLPEETKIYVLDLSK